MSDAKFVIYRAGGETKALESVREKMRKDPAYAIEVAKKAGILNKDGQLSRKYKRKK